MSLPHVAWAMDQTTGNPTRKAVLVALADFTNGETGKCCPYIATIAKRTELSEKTVQRALSDLVDAGFVKRTRRHRPDGKQAGYDYRLPAVLVIQVQREPVDTESDGQEVTESSQEPGTSLEPKPPPIGPPTMAVEMEAYRHWTVDRKRVTEPEHHLAVKVLQAYNDATAQHRSSQDALRMIVGRIREHPEVTLEQFVYVIADAVRHPWWEGSTTPNVIFGNGNVFESSLEAAKARARGAPSGGKPPPRRYGRGMTTREMLDTIPGGNT